MSFFGVAAKTCVVVHFVINSSVPTTMKKIGDIKHFFLFFDKNFEYLGV
jgi:hypothetical protein